MGTETTPTQLANRRAKRPAKTQTRSGARTTIMDKPDILEPAFPLHYAHSDFDKMRNGMSLRDYFAAMAMQSISVDTRGQQRMKECAAMAYMMADQMLAKRSEKKT